MLQLAQFIVASLLFTLRLKSTNIMVFLNKFFESTSVSYVHRKAPTSCKPNQWRIQDFPEDGVLAPKEGGANLLFGQFFPESCMKIKTFWTRGYVTANILYFHVFSLHFDKIADPTLPLQRNPGSTCLARLSFENTFTSPFFLLLFLMSPFFSNITDITFIFTT